MYVHRGKSIISMTGHVDNPVTLEKELQEMKDNNQLRMTLDDYQWM